MRTKLILILATLTLATGAVHSQAPVAPQVTAAAAVAPAAPVQGSSNGAAVLQALQQIKAANDEMLKKQATTLEQLDEMAKAADQIRIQTSRS